MKRISFRHAVLAAASTFVIVCVASGPAPAQQGNGKGGFRSRPKEPIKEEPTIWLSEGVPDLQGIWNNNWIVDMADGRYAEKTVDVPFTDWGRQLWEERTSTLQAHDPNLQCKPSGLPRAAGTPYPMQIVQLPKEVIFLYEGGLHTFRKVPVDGSPHKKDAWTWMGDSVGHYENGALIIDVTGFNDQQSWLDSAGHPHSEQLHLTETYRRLNSNTMRYTVTIDDPKAYTRPWTTSYIYRTRPGVEIMEYWCTENERDAQHMVGK
jgi:hypothetical protein